MWLVAWAVKIEKHVQSFLEAAIERAEFRGPWLTDLCINYTGECGNVQAKAWYEM